MAQTSNFMLNGELIQLESMASFVPYLFLFVAALLVNVVLSRLVQLQRGEIATLKAVGYGNRAIGMHYIKLVSVIVLAGAFLGVLAGAWLGLKMTHMYTDEYFKFPNPRYRLEAGTVGFSFGVSAITALRAQHTLITNSAFFAGLTVVRQVVVVGAAIGFGH